MRISVRFVRHSKNWSQRSNSNNITYCVTYPFNCQHICLYRQLVCVVDSTLILSEVKTNGDNHRHQNMAAYRSTRAFQLFKGSRLFSTKFAEPQLVRSVLYMPASNERHLTKLPRLPADVCILDLEDAVAPAAKDIARQNVRGMHLILLL